MSDENAWLELAERAEKAMEPERALDIALAIGCRYGATYHTGALHSFDGQRLQADMGREGWSWPWEVPTFSSSVDAMLSLIEETLPGWTWSVDVHDRVTGNESGWAWATVRPPDAHSGDFYRQTCPTPPLALLASYCQARAALSRSMKETRDD